MIHISRVDLTERGIVLPHDRVGMVIAQPHLTLTQQEPFRTVASRKPELLDNLTATLAVSRAAPHQAEKTHFTIFPEYSIPGLEGVDLIDAALADPQWPTGTIVIGGTDALSKTDFASLTARAGSHLDTEHNGLDQIGTDEWINCAITWTKAGDGTVERWLQPKLWPAWEEQHIVYQNMYRGKSVFSFKGNLSNGPKYRFSSLICFDWIATIGTKPSWRWALDDLGVQAGEGELSLSWMFVIQYNPRPSHPTFMGAAVSFFEGTIVPNVRRDRTCLVFANSAGKPVPGRSELYGGTSLVFSPQTLFQEAASRPTVAKGGPRFRGNPLLNAFRDTYFREKGACIHSFVQINPDSVIAGAANRTFAVDRPFVFPLVASPDPRTPSNLVPACVKWINDELDDITSLSDLQPAGDLSARADAAHATSIQELRTLSAPSCGKIIRLATARDGQANGRAATEGDADAWDADERGALGHVVNTLDLFGMCGGVTADAQNAGHATVSIGGKTLDLLAVRGKTHDQCHKYAQTQFTPNARRQALLITRDRDNLPRKRRSGSILQTSEPKLGDERKITEPESAIIHVDYQGLIAAFVNATTVDELSQEVGAHVGA
ncbi:hypothetical protein I6F30_33585 [Bradyrhizobium sp. NBAIM20]|uniref:hypothetical protein n=1 Tax=unclassified Bradyrhizobium TaxID=2631580 RepID=UPI001CD7223B|nr:MULTISPECIES: hypothetical protein [unclassified Bradyrhizobium]MCA1416021.1 hypothetical protein [Bradyrhizobium sp. NBAIM20]MCA1466061.1 hypothetical protein [Bradyrhizobium sp. NBAIM18]